MEAHSYSGGLRHTPFTDGVTRPNWVPSADEVGWRDDFEIHCEDAVVEFHQRNSNGETISWLAIYRRSTDAQFGDRSNHAGVGVWFRGMRILDSRSLLLALDQFVLALAKNPDPEALRSDVESFTSDRFLASYLLRADALPRDWVGAPASAATLVDSEYFFVTAPRLEIAVDTVAAAVTRLSLGWASESRAPRTVILVTSKPVPPTERKFKELDPPGAFIADLLEHLPKAFDEERRSLRDLENSLSHRKTEWERERQIQQERWDSERQQMQTLEGQPATLEGIAIRLNGISRQLTDIRGLIRDVKDVPKISDRQPYSATRYVPRRAKVVKGPSESEYTGSGFWLVCVISFSIFLMVGVIIYAVFRR